MIGASAEVGASAQGGELLAKEEGFPIFLQRRRVFAQELRSTDRLWLLRWRVINPPLLQFSLNHIANRSGLQLAKAKGRNAYNSILSKVPNGTLI